MSTALVVRDPKSQSLLARLKSAGMKFPGRGNRRRRRRGRGGRGRGRNNNGGSQRNGGRTRPGGPPRGTGTLIEQKGGLRGTRTYGAPTGFGSIRTMSSNPKIFGGLLSNGSVYDPEWGIGESCQIQSVITDIATNGATDVTGSLPFLSSVSGSLTSQAFSGFGDSGLFFTGIDLAPEYFVNSRLGAYAKLYNRFRWRRNKVTFYTGSNTNQTGQLALGISSDPIVFPEGNGDPVTPLPSYQSINNHNSTVSGSTWQNFSTDYKYDGKRAWYTRDPQDIPGMPTTGGEDTAADMRDIIQCRLMGMLKFVTTGVLRYYGYAELAGVIEFFDPVNTTATAALTPIDLTVPKHKGRYTLLKHPSGIPTVVRRGRVIPISDNRPPLYDPKKFDPAKPGHHMFFRPDDPSHLKEHKYESLDSKRRVDPDDDVKSVNSLDSTSFVNQKYIPKAPVRPVSKTSSTSVTPMSWEEASEADRG